MKLKMNPTLETSLQFYSDLRESLFEDVKQSGINIELLKPFLKFIKTEATDYEILNLFLKSTFPPQRENVEDEKALLNTFKNGLVESYKTSKNKEELVKVVTEVTVLSEFEELKEAKSKYFPTFKKAPGGVKKVLQADVGKAVGGAVKKVAKGGVLAGGATAILGGLAYGLKKLRDKKMGECRFYKGPQRNACLAKKEKEIRAYQISQLEKAGSACSKDANPVKCKQKISAKIASLKFK